MTSLKDNLVLITDEFLNRLLFERREKISLQLRIERWAFNSGYIHELIPEFYFSKRIQRIVPFPETDLLRFCGKFHFQYKFYCYIYTAKVFYKINNSNIK